MNITVGRLRELLVHDRDAGVLWWKECASDSPQRRAKYAGKEAFTSTDPQGYKQGRIAGKKLFAHRVLWALEFGYWPDGQIDHVNGDRSDNRLANLRLATPVQNAGNRTRAFGVSRHVGVHFRVDTGRWVAEIQHDRNRQYLGCFDSEDAAHQAYKAKAIELRGEYAAQWR